jgi:predicted Ser/Thr protein kinase
MLPLRDTDPREVGEYRLLGRLGEGGQGVVFLAVGPTGSRAAVKLLAPTTDPRVRSRFLKEVAAAQRVARFCTAQVLDAGIFERRPFIVSEYVSGPSLVEVVEQFGPRGGAVLERIAVATLTALGAVHAVGMVHRDFKPANVLLGPDGPVVIDFGLAAVPGMTTGLSGEVAVGTPAFMAPEHLAGVRVTAAADMWSWAVTMVFAGTGELPFKGESLTAIAYAILHSEPDVGRLPEPLGALVHRCLDKDAAARPSARGALTELVAAGARLEGPMPPVVSAPDADEETASSEQAPAAPPEPQADSGDGPIGGGLGSRLRWRRPGNGRLSWRWPAAAALTLILLAAAAGGIVFVSSGRGPSVERRAGSHTRISGPLAPEAAARKAAVTWILHQVSRAQIVGCDPVVCGDLSKGGFPHSGVFPLAGSTDVLNTNLVVATETIRNQFGSRLDGWAPAILASFGTGFNKIDIRWVYPGSAAVYRTDLRTGLRDRKAADALLLKKSSNIRFSTKAKRQVLSGQIDPYLAQLIVEMAAYHRVRVVDFAGQSPGGGPASLLRWVDLATTVRVPHFTPQAYLSWLWSVIHQQRTGYSPAWVQHLMPPHGQAVLRIGYGAPSPLS